MAPAAPARPTIEEVLANLRAAGGRVTAQRRAVLTALADAGPHPTAEDVAERVQQLEPSTHRSTVYRTLHTLADMGVITHVHLGHGHSVYHFADEAAAPHLMCSQCHTVTHLDRDTFADVASLVDSATGFQLEPGHFAWSARCPRCTDATDRAATATSADGGSPRRG